MCMHKQGILSLRSRLVLMICSTAPRAQTVAAKLTQLEEKMALRMTKKLSLHVQIAMR